MAAWFDFPETAQHKNFGVAFSATAVF